MELQPPKGIPSAVDRLYAVAVEASRTEGDLRMSSAPNEPRAQKSRKIPIRKPKSPMRLTMKALLPRRR